MNSEKHVQDIQKILDTGVSWSAVGAATGMSAELAVILYAHHATIELKRLRSENAKLKESLYTTEEQGELPEGWSTDDAPCLTIRRRDGAEVCHDIDVGEWTAWGGRKRKLFFGRWGTAQAAIAAVDQGYPIEPPPPEPKPTAAVQPPATAERK